jgi:amidase
LSNRRLFLQNAAMTVAGVALAPALQATQTSPVSSFELDEVTIGQLRHGMESGRYNSEQITQKYLDRIGQIDKSGPAINAVIEINPDALAIARQMDDERKSGKVRSALHGVPVLIKDNIATADKMQTTAGSLALVNAGAPGNKDSFVAAQLRKSGAVILGKTNLSEWANIRSTHSTSGWSGRGGLTACPYALDRNPSGSSSGSGSAVSANLCAAAVGSETDGSIVSPACSNGVVGIKPTVGLIGRTGIIPISHTQDTAGPMARTVSDAAALLSVLAGVDAADQAAAAAQGRIAPDYTRFLDPNGLRGVRLGIIKKYAGFSKRVDDLFDDAIAAMKDAGAEIVGDADVSTIGKWDNQEQAVLLYEFKAGLNRYLAGLTPNAPIRSLAELIAFNDKSRDQELKYFQQELLVQAQAKGDLNSDEYKKALADCRRLTRAEGIDAVMDKHKLDALICPTGTPAWLTDLINGDANEPSASSLAAVAGYPHITVPMGFIFGLPTGVSFIGRAWSEPTLIKVAFAYEQLSKHRKPPQFLPTASVQ